MPRAAKRMVKCEHCDYTFPTQAAKPRCGHCGKYDVIEIEDNATEEQKQKRGKGQKIQDLPVIIPFDLDTQNNIQFLMNLGIGKSPEDVVKRAVHNMRLLREGGKIKMENSKDLGETLEDLDKKRLMEVEIKRREAELERARQPDGQAKEEDLDSIINKWLKREMQVNIVERLKGGGTGSNSELEMLKQQIQQLTQQQNQEKLFSNFERRIEEMQRNQSEQNKLLLDALKDKKGDTQTDLITKFHEIEGKNKIEMEKIRADLDKARSETMQTQFISKMERLEDKLQQVGARKPLAESVAEIQGIKQLATEIGLVPKGERQEKSTAELAGELITNTIDKIKEPILEPLGQALAEKARGQQYTQTNPAAETQINITPSTNPEAKTNPNSEEDYSDIVNLK